jgi:hypothetical protein
VCNGRKAALNARSTRLSAAPAPAPPPGRRLAPAFPGRQDPCSLPRAPAALQLHMPLPAESCSAAHLSRAVLVLLCRVTTCRYSAGRA